MIAEIILTGMDTIKQWFENLCIIESGVSNCNFFVTEWIYMCVNQYRDCFFFLQKVAI